jgi:serine phosphatase RsbU (regulator of sigma subunit)
MSGEPPPAVPHFEKLVRRSFISALIGIAIVFLATFGVSSSGLRLRLIAYGALGGIFINLSCWALGSLYRRWTGPRAVGNERLVLSAVYFVGGLLGFSLATVVAAATSLVPPNVVRQVLPYSLGISGAIAIVVGLLFYTFSVMQERLRENVQRLKEHEFAEKELELAREIQQCLLPPQEVEGDGYRLAARNVAARFVAGDFYDVFRLADGAVGIVVADVAGKGIGASLIMASVKAMLPLIAADRSVEETLAELNRKLSADLGPREFVALAYLKYEKSGAFMLGNAGLPDPYRLSAGRPPQVLSVPGERMPLGARSGSRYQALSGNLEPGQRILLLTDGLPEALLATAEPMGYAALEALLSGADSASPSEFLDELFRRVRAATSPTVDDDLTALVLERLP